MLRSPYIAVVSLATTSLLFILCACGPSGASNEELIAKCDALASHPGDVGRRAIGVPESQIIPGLAIEACEKALKANPSSPRIQFQLGRAYLSADRKTDAVHEFAKSAAADYAPAMKYIGDAYLSGEGLPRNVGQNTEAALEWYDKASKYGFKDGKQAYAEVQKHLGSITLKLDGFNKPEYIQNIYNGTFDKNFIKSFFIKYIGDLVETLGSETVFFIDQHCRPLVNSIDLTMIKIAGAANLAKSFNNTDEFIGQLAGILAGNQADFGSRDAALIVNRYGCNNNPVTRRILENISPILKLVLQSANENYKSNPFAPDDN